MNRALHWWSSTAGARFFHGRALHTEPECGGDPVEQFRGAEVEVSIAPHIILLGCRGLRPLVQTSSPWQKWQNTAY
jgi:hypothetical protein